MSVLFRLVYASKCNGTHHKLAMDALRYLEHPESEGWTRLFLKNADSYIEGSKVPDKRFRDFRNHVLHVEDNFWGGAVSAARRWYDQTVAALQAGNWKEAVYSAGVLSHYYTDPVMPFHTGQSEEETQIHRAVEWSISKSYDDLFQLFETEYQAEIAKPRSTERQAELVQELVLQAAALSHRHYRNTIDHYKFDIGVQDPPEGLDAVLRETYARLLGYAAIGFARILEELIRDSGVRPPEVSLSLESVLAGLEIPIRWVTRKVADRQERLQIEAIYEEFIQTGRANVTLPEDDRQVRELHAAEVSGLSLSQLNGRPLEPIGTSFGKGGDTQKTSFLDRAQRDLSTAYERRRVNRPGYITTIEVIGPRTEPVARPVARPTPTPTPARTPMAAPTSAAVAPRIVATPKPKIRVKPQTKPETLTEPKPLFGSPSDYPQRPVARQAEPKQVESPNTLPLDPETGQPARPTAAPKFEPRPTVQNQRGENRPAVQETLKYYLHRSDPLIDAPSIGPKTAKRFAKIGIKTVDDFLRCDVDQVAQQLNVRHITPEELRDWQDQAEFVCRIPNLRGHDAQILVCSGIRKVEHLDGWEPKSLLEMVAPFVQSPDGVRLLRGSGEPDLSEVTNWLRWSNSARSLRAA